jgi:hypothetical protein
VIFPGFWVSSKMDPGFVTDLNIGEGAEFRERQLTEARDWRHTEEGVK